MRFWHWATDYVSYLISSLWRTIYWVLMMQLEHQHLPENDRKVTLENPPSTHMFDVPPSVQKRGKSTSAMTSSIPQMILNMPDMQTLQQPWQSPCWSQTPHIASDPADYNNKPWPSLHEFLCDVQVRDCHGCDPVSHEQMLCEQEILGPNDVTRCSTDELHEHCSIPIGTAKFYCGRRCMGYSRSQIRVHACKHQKWD